MESFMHKITEVNLSLCFSALIYDTVFLNITLAHQKSCNVLYLDDE